MSSTPDTAPKAGWGETRERVRKLLASGYPPRRIAEELGITPQSVYLHMDAIRAESERDGHEPSAKRPA